jgi:1,4-alpha-glucan branching enzyme
VDVETDPRDRAADGTSGSAVRCAERLTLNQAAREALLMQSSDWSFLVTTGQAREYAIQRFNQHFERFDKLASKLEAGEADAALAQEFFEQDNLFPDINYRDFAT